MRLLPFLLLSASALGWPTNRCTLQADDRPNVIVILVDDMGFSDIGCYGGEIETPNLDRLAADGIRYTQFYNAGRCCPTRASLMTGRHPHQVGIGHMTESPGKPLGITGPYQGFLNDHCTTIAEVLKSAGYHSLMVGKWHLGFADKNNWPLQRGFDRYFGGVSGAFNYFKPGGDRQLVSGNEVVKPADDFYATDTFTERAIDFIDEATNDNEDPFFLYLAYNAPHWPLNAKWEDFQKYKGKYTGGWSELAARRLAKQKRIGLFDQEVTPAKMVGPDWQSLSADKRDDLDSIMAAYAGCIDSIDQNIGRLVDHLRETEKLDNTMILFLSDNGACQEGGMLGKGSTEMVRNPPLETTAGVRLGMAWANACNTPFRLYKHFVHEGGACTPMIAHWPQGIAEDLRGTFNRHYAYLPDVMATCLELGEAKYPSNLPPHVGRSLKESFRDADSAVHDETLFWEHEGNAAARDGRWKLVREYKKPWELYDLSVDRTESQDLSETYPDKRQEMIESWESWATGVGVAFPERFNMYEFLRRK